MIAEHFVEPVSPRPRLATRAQTLRDTPGLSPETVWLWLGAGAVALLGAILA
jgi:hypothetical protein